MEIILHAFFGFFLGLLCGGSVALLGSVAIFTFCRIPNFEGSASMAVAFVVLPACTLLGGVVGAIRAIW